MSYHGTLRVTRAKAMEELFKRMVGDLSNTDLEKLLDKELDSRGWMAQIVPEDDLPNDDAILGAWRD